MLDKMKDAMNVLYTMTQDQIKAYRKIGVDSRDAYWEFSHEMAGVTAVATFMATADEYNEISEYANELREKVWNEVTA